MPYTVPALICQGQTYLDCIEKVLEEAEQALSRRYLFFDKVGSLTLVPVQQTALDVLLQSGENIFSYQFGTSVDKDVFTEVKLTQYPATSAKYRSKTVQNRARMAEWGRLRYFAKVDRELNQAQVQSRAEAILSDHAAALETLVVTAPGEIACVAGFRPRLIIEELGVDGYCLIESAEHIVYAGDINALKTENTDVVGNRHIRDQLEVLEDIADPFNSEFVLCLLSSRTHFHAVNRDAALGRGENAGDHI